MGGWGDGGAVYCWPKLWFDFSRGRWLLLIFRRIWNLRWDESCCELWPKVRSFVLEEALCTTCPCLLAKASHSKICLYILITHHDKFKFSTEKVQHSGFGLLCASNRGCWMISHKGLMPGLFVESVGKEIIAEKLLNWKLRCQNSLYMV